MIEFFGQIGNFFNDIISNVLNFLFDLSFNVMDLFFGWISLPHSPDGLNSSINSYLDLIFNNSGFLFFFIRRQTFSVLLMVLPIVWTSKIWYRLIKWVIKKVPLNFLLGG